LEPAGYSDFFRGDVDLTEASDTGNPLLREPIDRVFARPDETDAFKRNTRYSACLLEYSNSVGC